MVTACVTTVTRMRSATSRNNKVQIGQRSKTRQLDKRSIHTDDRVRNYDCDCKRTETIALNGTEWES